MPYIHIFGYHDKTQQGMIEFRNIGRSNKFWAKILRKNGKKTWILAKNWPICPVWAPSAGGKKFFELSCRLGSVRNMVRSKICANQGNRTTPSGPNQENPYFPHFSPEFPRNKFENFFKNSYRTIVLTNSSKEVPKFCTRCKKYKIRCISHLIQIS